jgi:hypothetical protein
LCSDRLAEPLHALPDERRRVIQQHLKDLDLLHSVRPALSVARPDA